MMVDREGVINASTNVDVYGVNHLSGRQANEDIGGGFNLDLS